MAALRNHSHQLFVGYVKDREHLKPVVVQNMDGTFLRRNFTRRDLIRLEGTHQWLEADIGIRHDDDHVFTMHGCQITRGGGFVFYFHTRNEDDRYPIGCIPLEGAQIEAGQESPSTSVSIAGEQIPLFSITLISDTEGDRSLLQQLTRMSRHAEDGGLTFLTGISKKSHRAADNPQHVLSAAQHLLVSDHSIVRIKGAVEHEAVGPADELSRTSNSPPPSTGGSSLQSRSRSASPVPKAAPRTGMDALLMGDSTAGFEPGSDRKEEGDMEGDDSYADFSMDTVDEALSSPLSTVAESGGRERANARFDDLPDPIEASNRLIADLKYFIENPRLNDTLHLFNIWIYVLTQLPMVLVAQTTFRKRKAYTPYLIFVANVLIWVSPHLLIRFYARTRTDGASVTIVFWAYLSIFLGPVVWVILRLARNMKSKDCVPQGTFCMRPSAHLRCATGNLLYIFGMVVEFFQLSIYNLPARYFNFEDDGVNGGEGDDEEDMNDESSLVSVVLNYNYMFWGVMVIIIFNFSIIVCRITLEGTKRHRLEAIDALWAIVNFVSAPMFVSICTICIQALSCDYSEDPPVLRRDASIVCWSGYHQGLAHCALTGLSYYLTQVSLLPTATYKESIRNESFDVLFVPIYLQMHFIVKGLYCFIYVSLYQFDWIRVPVLTGLTLFILLLHTNVTPSPLPAINMLRTTFMCGILWAGVVSMLFMAYNPQGSAVSIRVFLITCICVGWALFFCGRLTQYWHSTDSIELRVDKALVNLKYQNRDIISPRILEPLIAVSLSKDPKDSDIAKKRCKQILWLCGWEHKRVQYQAAWFLCNVAERFEESRHDILYSPYRSLFLQMLNSEEPQVHLETLAALVNISSVEDPALQHQFVKLRWVTRDLKLTEESLLKRFVLEMDLTKGLKATFKAMICCNVARTTEGCAVLQGLGAMGRLVQLAVSDSILNQQFSLRALGNMLCMSELYDPLLTTTPVLYRLLQLARSKALLVQSEALRVLVNLSAQEEIALALAADPVKDILKPLKEAVLYNESASFIKVRMRFVMLMMNVYLNDAHVNHYRPAADEMLLVDEAQYMRYVQTKKSLADMAKLPTAAETERLMLVPPEWKPFFEQYVPKVLYRFARALVQGGSFRPLRLQVEAAQVTWDVWPSKIDHFTMQRKFAILTHLEHLSSSAEKVIKVPFRTPFWFLEWRLEVLQDSKNGTISKVEVGDGVDDRTGENVKVAQFTYDCDEGFEGTDYFIYRWTGGWKRYDSVFQVTGSVLVTMDGLAMMNEDQHIGLRKNRSKRKKFFRNRAKTVHSRSASPFRKSQDLRGKGARHHKHASMPTDVRKLDYGAAEGRRRGHRRGGSTGMRRTSRQMNATEISVAL